MSYSNFTPVTEGILAEQMFQDIRAGHMFEPGTGAPSAFGPLGLQEPVPGTHGIPDNSSFPSTIPIINYYYLP